MFVTGLTDCVLSKLDYFEGREYHRARVKVNLLACTTTPTNPSNVEGEERMAEVYIFSDASNLEDDEWDLEEFRRDRLQAWTRPGYVQGRKPSQIVVA